MKMAYTKLLALALITLMVTACGSLPRSSSDDDQKSPSLAEQINIRRDRH